MKKRKKNTNRSVLVIIILALSVFAGIQFYQVYNKIYGPNVQLDKNSRYLYIPSESTFDSVKNILFQQNYIEDTSSFLWVAKKKNFINHINPGRYLIKNKMSNNKLVNLLRAGKQEPVDLVFHNIRTKEELASRIAAQIEADSSKLINLLKDDDFLDQYNFNSKNIYAMFIPNTYELYWNTSAKELIDRMYKEYNRFWSDQREKKAEELDFSRVEVSTLASIVDEETVKKDEMDMIAGVYINRLKRGMRLQADPTVKFAIGDFSVKRILDKHLKIDSPYNTYRHGGLPPGPITIPSIAAIEAVLNYKDHKYLYFCAKPDFSGYHNFSKTHYQHIRNAKKYQQALNERNILK
jgi:UPF0755 protein